MEKKKRKSLQFSKKVSIFKSPTIQSRINAQRESYESGLSKIFSSPPSHLGYQNDIESLINEIGLKSEELLYFTISSLSRIARNKNEINIIASYLYLMPNIIKLLKGTDLDKKEQDILKDLLNLSQSMAYEKYQSNSILMKFGDKGSTAYVNLDGQVDVLTKSFKYMNVTKNDYLFYLANLLKYSEYGLLNEAINENFSTFPLEIYDGTKVKEMKFSFKNDDSEINMMKIINDSYKDKKNDDLSRKTKNVNYLGEKTRNNDDDINSSSNSLFKLNEENEQMKEFKSVLKLSTNRLLKMFNLKKIDKKSKILNFCSLNDYIKRIELIIDNYKNYIIKDNNNSSKDKEKEKEKDKEKEKEKKNEKNKGDKNEEKETENDEDNKLYNLKIFTYIKVATLGKGALFGEIALREANSLRTGTLITSSECHCSVLNKRTFDICLKKGAEKYLKEVLTFIVNLPIFIGLSETLFYHKYYTNLSKKIMHRGNLVITQGEIPKNIILIQTGSYGLITRKSLFDLTKLILHFIKENLKNKNNLNIIYDPEIDKYNRLLKKTNFLMNEASSLMNENIKFKKFYLNEMLIRVTDIACPDMVGYKEYVDENGLYAFSIESKSPENVIFTLDNKFYSDLQQKNYTVRNNQKELLEKKVNAMIQRLFIIRNSLVKSFFDDKCDKEIGTMVIKELENFNTSKLRQKRFLKFKSIKNKINKKTIEEEFDNNNKSNHKKSKDKNKYKKIKNLSRNNKINNNINFFNSYNERETKRKKLLRSISNSYNINISKSPYKTKKEKKTINLHKSSRTIFSAKRSNEDVKKIIKKKKILDYDINDKLDLFSQTLKESNSKYKLNTKDNTESSSKLNFDIQSNKTAKMQLKSPPKINSANIPYRNNEIREIFLNSLVWEEIKTKIGEKINYKNNFINKLSLSQRNKKFMNIFEKSISFKKITNEEIRSPFNSCRHSSGKIIFSNRNKSSNIKMRMNSPSFLHRSSSEISFHHNYEIKKNLLNEINSPKGIYNYSVSKQLTNTANNKNIIYNYMSSKKGAVPKINLKIKKLFSPQEIKLLREINEKRNDINIINYHEKKIEKYKIDRNFYYNNNLKNRMKLFYNIEKKKIN